MIKKIYDFDKLSVITLKKNNNIRYDKLYHANQLLNINNDTIYNCKFGIETNRSDICKYNNNRLNIICLSNSYIYEHVNMWEKLLKNSDMYDKYTLKSNIINRSITNLNDDNEYVIKINFNNTKKNKTTIKNENIIIDKLLRDNENFKPFFINGKIIYDNIWINEQKK